MARIPEAKPGRVIRYEYLWRRQALKGQETAEKERPACIVLAVRNEAGTTRVLIVPITHAAPRPGEPACRIPPRVKQHLGLDDELSWIILSEANIDVWPSPDLRPIPGRNGVVDYGLLPQKLVNQLRETILAAIRERRLSATDREARDPAQEADLSSMNWSPE